MLRTAVCSPDPRRRAGAQPEPNRPKQPPTPGGAFAHLAADPHRDSHDRLPGPGEDFPRAPAEPRPGPAAPLRAGRGAAAVQLCAGAGAGTELRKPPPCSPQGRGRGDKRRPRPPGPAGGKREAGLTTGAAMRGGPGATREARQRRPRARCSQRPRKCSPAPTVCPATASGGQQGRWKERDRSRSRSHMRPARSGGRGWRLWHVGVGRAGAAPAPSPRGSVQAVGSGRDGAEEQLELERDFLSGGR